VGISLVDMKIIGSADLIIRHNEGLTPEGLESFANTMTRFNDKGHLLCHLKICFKG
jgi:hypothetical protein